MYCLRFLFFFLILSAASLSTKAQSETLKKEFGQTVFYWLTDSLSADNKVEFIRLRTWRELISRQPIDASEKADRRLKMQEQYGALYEAFQRESTTLREQNLKEIAEGASFEPLSFKLKPVPNTVDIFEGHLRVLYKKGAVQNMTTYRFRVFYNGRGLGLLTAPEEDF